MREFVPSDIITEKLLRDGKLKQTETEVDDALESRFTPRDFLFLLSLPRGKTSLRVKTLHPSPLQRKESKKKLFQLSTIII